MENKYSKLKKRLTRREKQISIHLVGFTSYKKIAESLWIQESTLRKHASNILKKAELKNRDFFRKKYPRISEYMNDDFDTMTTPCQSGKPIELKWKDESAFEDYYIEFSNMLESMYNFNFSKEVIESNERPSFIDFIGKGLNTLNYELKRQYFDLNILTDMLEALNIKNRIVVLSKDNLKVSHLSVSSDEIIVRSQEVKGELLDNLFTLIEEIPFLNTAKVRLNPKIFLSVQKQNAFLEKRIVNGITIYALTLAKEYKLQQLLPRILTLIATIKEQQEDDTYTWNSVIGNSIAIEANSLFNQLFEYMSTYKG